MFTPDLAHILFAVLTLGLMLYIVRLRYLRNQQARRHQQRRQEQLDLIETYIQIMRSQDEHIAEVYTKLRDAYFRLDEYRTELRHIDNQLQSDPVQFIHTTEESPRV